MAYYKMPIAEYVYTEHFKEMNVAQDVYSTFTDKNNANDKFLYVYGLLKHYDWLPRQLDGFIKLSQSHRRWRKRLKRRLNKMRITINMDCSTTHKSNDISDQYRIRGNEEFKSQNYEESLKLYTLSILTAEIDSLNYVLSVANRSAALYYLEEYEHSLKDLDRALSSNEYPSQNKYKLFERKGNCYRHMNHQSLALEMYSSCLLHLNSTSQSLNTEQIKDRVTENINKCKKNEDNTTKVKMKCLDLSESNNYNISGLSRFVEVKYSEDMGRGLFASKDIKPGEILIMEKPFAGVCTNITWIFNCDYCFKRCLSAIPCSKCSQVLYCDEVCLQKARQSYHDVECSLVNPLKGDPTVEPNCGLAMRCFIQLTNLFGIDRYCSLVKEYNEVKLMNPAECNENLTNNFYSIYALDGNESKRTVSNLFFMHCTASMMLSLLLLNDFHIPTNMLGTVGESLVHLLCVVNLSSYASVELPKYIGGSNDDLFNQPRNTVALVLCTVYSLINHSCDPNVIVQTYSGIEVTRALQPIPKGSQLFTDYGVNFMSYDKVERDKHLLDQYQFNCQCQACTQNWPIYTSLELNELFASNSDHLEEDKLSIPKVTLAKFNEIEHLLKTQCKINVDYLEFLFSFLSTLNSNFEKPCSIYYKCIQIIQKCLFYTSDQLNCNIE